MAELAHLEMPTTESADITNGETTASNMSVVLDDDNVFHNDQFTSGISVGSSNISPPGSSHDNDPLMDSYKPSNEAELLGLVRQQLEYYFSKDNISADKYLLSQMDGDHFVPISILASFNQVKRLTSDNDLLIKAITDSNVLQIDMTLAKVRAIPEKRCTLILREIPKETPKEDIQQLFNGETCPKFISCEFAENDCWYVTFPGEDDAQEAHRYLREEVKHFNGNPIRARIKNMAAQRSTTVPKPRPQYPYSMSMPMQNLPFYAPQSPPVGWPFFDPRFTTQYPNGFPPQPAFTGTTQNNNSGNVGGRNYSVGSADSRRDGGGGNRDMIRRGSAGSKRYDTDKRPVTGYPGNRYKRDDDRLRNLPNRLRNKRAEEMMHSVTSNNSDNNKDDLKKDRPTRQPRFSNRPPPKLDFAPVNFPPLPTSQDLMMPPPAPPPPPVAEEGNPKLADIVKGNKHKGNGVNDGAINKSPTAKVPPAVSIATTIISTTTPDIKTMSTPTVTMTTTPTVPVVATKTMLSSSSKDKNNNNKSGHRNNNDIKYSTSQTRTTQQSNRGGAGNGNRSRHKDSKKQPATNSGNNNSSTNSVTTNTNSTTNTKQKLSTNSTKSPINDAPSPITINKDEQDTDPLVQSPTTNTSSSSSRPEKLSYAQMAQQKPKPSPQKQSKQPSSPIASSSEAPLPVPPSSPPSSTNNDDNIS